MPTDIRTSIYRVDLFDPENGCGYSLDTFYHHSDELTEYSPEYLESELGALVAEGCLKQEDDANYYWATKEGKIARQKHFAKLGILQKPLADQRSYALHDLILAILASNRVSPFSGSDHISLDALSIYLHEYPDDSLKETVAELEAAGLIGSSDWFNKHPLHITGRGLQKYKTDNRFRLDLGVTEGILRLIEEVEKDAHFSKLGFDADFQDNLEHRWSEMETCAFGGAYLAAVIMLGSILEGALLAKLKGNIQAAMTSKKAPRDKSGSARPIDDWTLADYIAVSTELGFVPKSVEKHSHELRDTRNLVHPRKQVSEQITVDESLYRISREIAETVLDALSS